MGQWLTQTHARPAKSALRQLKPLALAHLPRFRTATTADSANRGAVTADDLRCRNEDETLRMRRSCLYCVSPYTSVVIQASPRYAWSPMQKCVREWVGWDMLGDSHCGKVEFDVVANNSKFETVPARRCRRHFELAHARLKPFAKLCRIDTTVQIWEARFSIE